MGPLSLTGVSDHAGWLSWPRRWVELYADRVEYRSRPTDARPNPGETVQLPVGAIWQATVDPAAGGASTWRPAAYAGGGRVYEPVGRHPPLGAVLLRRSARPAASGGLRRKAVC